MSAGACMLVSFDKLFWLLSWGDWGLMNAYVEIQLITWCTAHRILSSSSFFLRRERGPLLGGGLLGMYSKGVEFLVELLSSCYLIGIVWYWSWRRCFLVWFWRRRGATLVIKSGSFAECCCCMLHFVFLVPKSPVDFNCQFATDPCLVLAVLCPSLWISQLMVASPLFTWLHWMVILTVCSFFLIFRQMCQL